MFGATYDPSDWIKTSGNGFIAVMIQYRLGAFGFLSSDDVHRHGTTNAGLLDMRFALKWVQDHIAQFGGDPTRVTIGGESSGAGGVMYQALAYGGQEDGLFKNVRAFFKKIPCSCENNADIPRSLLRVHTVLQCTSIMTLCRLDTIKTLQDSQDALERTSLEVLYLIVL